jgi:hypothetical protein
MSSERALCAGAGDPSRVRQVAWHRSPQAFAPSIRTNPSAANKLGCGPSAHCLEVCKLPGGEKRLHNLWPVHPAAPAPAPRATPPIADPDSQGPMDHPNRRLIENG